MYQYKIKVQRVVDGDTVDFLIDLGFDITIKKRVRLAGINAPESRTLDLEEKAKGMAAKKWLRHRLKQSEHALFMNSEKVGKYGRVLGVIYATGSVVSINDEMVAMGHAVEYDGGKR